MLARALLEVTPMSGVRSQKRLEVLYVSYDGLLEPLGQSQIVRYAEGLADEGLHLSILSFEKPRDLGNVERRNLLRAELESRGISWFPLLYHRHPRLLATAWDVLNGIATGLELIEKDRPDVVHARSYVAGLMGLVFKAAGRSGFVFDMRGFWPEERVELGLFQPQGLLYRASKRLESRLLAASDHVVVLTESAKSILREREAKARLATRDVRETPMSVIPCCVDVERYRPLPRDAELSSKYRLDSSVVIGNIGAVNHRYLVQEMFRFAFHLKTHRPDLRFVYLTEQDPAALRSAATAAGLGREDVLVLRAEPEDVPRWLSLFRLGVFFLRPSYAAKASSFTKLGEFLAAGVPVVTNTGVGDVDRILGADRSCLLLPGLTDRELSAFARKALPLLEGGGVPDEVRRQCRATAVAQFALAEGVARYHRLYDSVASVPERTAEAQAVAGAG
jgi:glycosyltransferase involved in cell wall biosynthesis